jgi:hypothetical protein
MKHQPDGAGVFQRDSIFPRPKLLQILKAFDLRASRPVGHLEVRADGSIRKKTPMKNVSTEGCSCQTPTR